VRRAENDGYEIYEDACHEGERTSDELVVPSTSKNPGDAATLSKK